MKQVQIYIRKVHVYIQDLTSTCIKYMELLKTFQLRLMGKRRNYQLFSALFKQSTSCLNITLRLDAEELAVLKHS